VSCAKVLKFNQGSLLVSPAFTLFHEHRLLDFDLSLKECMSDSVTSYNYVGDTKVSVSIKKTNANKCTLSEIFLSEILKSFSFNSSKGQVIQTYNLPVECNNSKLVSDQSKLRD